MPKTKYNIRTYAAKLKSEAANPAQPDLFSATDPEAQPAQPVEKPSESEPTSGSVPTPAAECSPTQTSAHAPAAECNPTPGSAHAPAAECSPTVPAPLYDQMSTLLQQHLDQPLAHIANVDGRVKTFGTMLGCLTARVNAIYANTKDANYHSFSAADCLTTTAGHLKTLAVHLTSLDTRLQSANACLQSVNARLQSVNSRLSAVESHLAAIADCSKSTSNRDKLNLFARLWHSPWLRNFLLILLSLTTLLSVFLTAFLALDNSRLRDHINHTTLITRPR